MKALPYLLAGCLGGLVTSGHAQSLVINASAVGDLQHSHAGHLVSTDLQTFAAPTPAVSLRDYNAVQFTFKAPEGYAWETRDDVAGTANGVRCKFAYGSQGTASTDRVWDYNFAFVPGMASTVDNTGYFQAWVSDTGFGFNGKFMFAGDIAFTALTITVHAAPGIDPLPLDSFTLAQLGFEMTGNVPASDPGPHTFLAPVPEPEVYALLGVGGVFFLLRRRSRRVVPA